MKKALTLAEMAVVFIVVGFLVCAATNTLRIKDFKQNALKKQGEIVYTEISAATTQLLVRDSYGGTLSTLLKKDGVSRFSIEDKGIGKDLIELYKKNMKISRDKPDMSYSGYEDGFVTKSGVFITLKAYGNCTTTTKTYNPSLSTETQDEENTCIAIFYDVNGKEPPNDINVDRYILAIDKRGLR